MNEASFQKKCRLEAEKRGLISYKIESNLRGLPDCVILGGGKTLWVEFKSPKKTGRVHPLQTLRHQELKRAGARVVIVNHLEGFIEVVEGFFDVVAP